MAKRIIDQVDVKGRRVLMRVDFNVPMNEVGEIVDDRRIRMALPSIRSVVDRGGRLILMSHCGRPAGKGFEAPYSLRPAARRLEELVGRPVQFPSKDCVDATSSAAVASLGSGEIILLENLRFAAGEKKGDGSFAAALAAYGDIYCNDAFGTAHRNDASMVAVPEAMAGKPRVAGFLLQRELTYLKETLEHPAHPFAAVLGGAKVSDKLGAIRNLLGRVDQIFVGGAMAYTFLAAQGIGVGSSRVERDMEAEAASILQAAASGSTSILLPTDHVCGQALEVGTPVKVFNGAIEQGWMGLDIGPKTTSRYCAALREARTIVWNGPLGVFEIPPFDVGTREVAAAIVQATAAGAVSVVGGGDSAAAVEACGLSEHVSHVSTGGGASLELLEGKSFRSVELLDEA